MYLIVQTQPSKVFHTQIILNATQRHEKNAKKPKKNTYESHIQILYNH